MRKASMQKRHFELIARTISELPVSAKTKRTVAEAFAASIAHTNGQLKRERFIEWATRTPETLAAKELRLNRETV